MFEFCLHSVRAVSYTHLDVYKRQVKDRRFAVRIFFKYGFTIGGCSIPLFTASPAYWASFSGWSIIQEIKSYSKEPNTRMGTDGLSGSSVITINRLFNKLLRAIDGSASITNSVVLPGLSVFRFSFMFRERFSFATLCIVNRLFPVFVIFKVCFLAVFPLMIPKSMTVSYTHLDVYKRQVKLPVDIM